MSAIEGVSETFDASQWDVVPGFEDLSDLTYHRAKAHGTVRIAFDRPDVLNAFRPHTVDELLRTLEHARTSGDVGCVILTGNGPSAKNGKWSFCTGGDQRIRGKAGYQYEDKINSAYENGGPRLTLKTVKKLFEDATGDDFPINHIVNINFGGFRRAIDYIGCVYVDIDRRYFNDRGGPGGYATIDLKPGYQKLCGSDSLDYVRYRHTDDDFVRALYAEAASSADYAAVCVDPETQERVDDDQCDDDSDYNGSGSGFFWYYPVTDLRPGAVSLPSVELSRLGKYGLGLGVPVDVLLGRLVCLLLSIYAFAVFGYITATLASWFIGTDTAEERQRSARLEAELSALRHAVETLTKAR